MNRATTIRLPDELWKRARIEAIRRGVSLSGLVETALDDLLTTPIPPVFPGASFRVPKERRARVKPVSKVLPRK